MSNDKIIILDTVLPHVAAYNKAASLQIPVHRFEKKRHGPTISANATMCNLVKELLSLDHDTINNMGDIDTSENAVNG